MNPDRFLRLVGLNVRKARHLAGLSLGRATTGRGGERFLAEVEGGRRSPTLSWILSVAEKFGVTPADLVNIPGLRPGPVPLDEQEAEPPPRGRPKGSKTSKATRPKKAQGKKAASRRTPHHR